MQAEEQLDINENFISKSQNRSRAKSDPSLKSIELVADPESPAQDGSGFRGRAKTMENSKRTGRFFCDSCKAKLKAGGVTEKGTSGKHAAQNINACASCEGGAVDLMALPPPGSEEDEEIENGGGKLQPPPPAIAAPPPGFRDNSSDEDDAKKNRKAASTTGATAALAPLAVTQEKVPVTLIDNVAPRTVRDHAQELDDALVSTLQALEALAASEDYPHQQQQTPQTAGGHTKYLSKCKISLNTRCPHNYFPTFCLMFYEFIYNSLKQFDCTGLTGPCLLYITSCDRCPPN